MISAPPRRVRSYVRRERPLKAQALATLERLWPSWGLEEPLWAGLGAHDRPLVLDIGFGDGEALLAMAKADPGRDYVGIEMYRTGVIKVLREIEEHKLTNIRLIQADAKNVIASVTDGKIDAVHLFFPDPWPKVRHHKRRLVQAGFLAEVLRILHPGGLFHMATDWAHYADEVLSLIATVPSLQRLEDGRGTRPLTKFERRGERLGHVSADLRFAKTP